MKRKLKTLIAMALLVMLTLCGCTTATPSTTETTDSQPASESQTAAQETASDEASGEVAYAPEISYWAVASNQELTDAIIKGFNEKYPDIHINVTYNGVDDQKSALKVAASSGTLPDMWYIYGGTLGSFYPENGLTYDLRQVAEKNHWEDLYNPSAIELVQLGGQFSGLTVRADSISWIYRTDVFEKCGLETPKTFEEFEAALAAIKSNGYTPLAFGGQNGWDVMRLLEWLIEYYGGADLHDQLLSLDADWNCEAVQKSFAKYKEWVDLGYFPEGFVTLAPYDVWMYMYSGEYAMHIGGSLELNQIIQANGDIEPYGTFNVGDIRISIYGNIAQINANVDEAKLNSCLLFLQYLIGEEGAEAAGDLAKYPLPVKGAAIPEYMGLVSDVIAQEENGTFLIIDQAMPQEIVNKIFEMQDSVALGIATPEQAAEALSTAIAEYKAAA